MPGTLGSMPCIKCPVDRVIDITNSSTVPANELRRKLDLLQIEGMNDGGLPVISHGALVGLVPAVAVKSVLKETKEITDSTYLLSTQGYGYSQEGTTSHGHEVDLTFYIDKVRLCSSNGFQANVIAHFTQSPIVLEADTPIQFVYECFRNLGLSHLCVVRDGKFIGLVSELLICVLKKVNAITVGQRNILGICRRH